MQESFEHLIIVSFYFAPSFLRERPFQAAKSAVAASAVADGPGMGPALTPSPVKRRLTYTSVRVASKKDGRSRSEEGRPTPLMRRSSQWRFTRQASST